MWATGSPYNLNGYSNPAVDALIQQLQDTGVTSQQLLELRQLIQRDLPDIPLFYHETPITYIRQLRALEDREISLSTFSSVHAWYLDESIKLEAKVQESS
jgi:ABC-type oligopeptide transport system substrate-binding subunit